MSNARIKLFSATGADVISPNPPLSTAAFVHFLKKHGYSVVQEDLQPRFSSHQKKEYKN